jgi:hypothetical protein
MGRLEFHPQEASEVVTSIYSTVGGRSPITNGRPVEPDGLSPGAIDTPPKNPVSLSSLSTADSHIKHYPDYFAPEAGSRRLSTQPAGLFTGLHRVTSPSGNPTEYFVHAEGSDNG